MSIRSRLRESRFGRWLIARLRASPPGRTLSEQPDEVRREQDEFVAPVSILQGPAESALATPLHINLGLDVGTSFTKACYRDVFRDRSGIVAWSDGAAPGLISSAVVIDVDGTIHRSSPEDLTSGSRIEFLKMRLVEPALVPDSPIPGAEDPALSDSNLNEALYAWLIADTVVRAQKWLLANEPLLLEKRAISWSANIAVPIEHYDSEHRQTFARCASIAWHWIATRSIPSSLSLLISSYRIGRKHFDDALATNDQLLGDCHAVPELAAAVYSFVVDHQPPQQIYAFVDIGGGTFDAAVFNLVNSDGERQINFYAGRVAPLGVQMVAKRLAPENLLNAIDILLSESSFPAPSQGVNTLRKEVQTVVADVVVRAKKKDRRDWESEAFASFLHTQTRQSKPASGNKLTIFLGGGGAGSAWYRQTILHTYGDFRHDRSRIPRYVVAPMPLPQRLQLNGISADAYHRFSVSYGLSIPFGEGPIIGLPRLFDEIVPPIRRSGEDRDATR